MKKLIAFLNILLSPAAFASGKPLWEAGVGLGIYYAPHYLGSDQTFNYTVPIPYLVFRGEFLKSGHGGLAGKIYESNRLDLHLSLGGSLPVSNENNRAREGMPDLDLILEAGPNLQYRLFKDNNHELRLDLPLRAAFSFGKDIDYQGAIFNPRFYYRFEPRQWRLTASVGPVYGSAGYHAYFYDVTSRYATDNRPEYRSGAGYTGLRYSVSFGQKFDRLFVGAFLNYYDLSGAANEESPLVRKTGYAATGLAISWVFAESASSVGVTDTDD